MCASYSVFCLKLSLSQNNFVVLMSNEFVLLMRVGSDLGSEVHWMAEETSLDEQLVMDNPFSGQSTKGLSVVSHGNNSIS